MLDSMDFFFMYLIVYFAMITSLMTVLYMVYRYGLPRAEKYITNHLITKIMHKVKKKLISDYANDVKAGRAAPPQAQKPDGMMGMLGQGLELLSNPMVQQVLGGFGQAKPPTPPQGGVPPPI